MYQDIFFEKRPFYEQAFIKKKENIKVNTSVVQVKREGSLSKKSLESSLLAQTLGSARGHISLSRRQSLTKNNQLNNSISCRILPRTTYISPDDSTQSPLKGIEHRGERQVELSNQFYHNKTTAVLPQILLARYKPSRKKLKDEAMRNLLMKRSDPDAGKDVVESVLSLVENRKQTPEKRKRNISSLNSKEPSPEFWKRNLSSLNSNRDIKKMFPKIQVKNSDRNLESFVQPKLSVHREKFIKRLTQKTTPAVLSYENSLQPAVSSRKPDLRQSASVCSISISRKLQKETQDQTKAVESSSDKSQHSAANSDLSFKVPKMAFCVK